MNEQTMVSANHEISKKFGRITKQKILLTALVLAVVEQIYGGLTCGWLFSWIYSIKPTSAWKYGAGVTPDWNVMFASFVGSFILHVILIAVFVILYNSIPYKGWKRGVKFGFLVWAVSILPGMFATYMWMNVAFAYVIYMTIAGLASLLIRGVILGAMIRK